LKAYSYSKNIGWENDLNIPHNECNLNPASPSYFHSDNLITYYHSKAFSISMNAKMDKNRNKPGGDNGSTCGKKGYSPGTKTSPAQPTLP
jgi:hypothetical protein